MAPTNPLLDILEALLVRDEEMDSLELRREQVVARREEFLRETYQDNTKLLGLHNVIHKALCKGVSHEESRRLLVNLLADMAAFMVPPLAAQHALQHEEPVDEPNFCEVDCARLLEELTTAYVEQCTALGFMT